MHSLLLRAINLLFCPRAIIVGLNTSNMLAVIISFGSAATTSIIDMCHTLCILHWSMWWLWGRSVGHWVGGMHGCMSRVMNTNTLSTTLHRSNSKCAKLQNTSHTPCYSDQQCKNVKCLAMILTGCPSKMPLSVYVQYCCCVIISVKWSKVQYASHGQLSSNESLNCAPQSHRGSLAP